jgi:ornithine cyclodeaminase
MLILNAAEIRRALPMRHAVAAMKEAFAAFSSGRAVAPPRAHLPIERNAGITLVMPAYIDADAIERQALAVKVVSLFDGNRARGLARIQAAVLLIEPDSGKPVALLEGATLTAIRTAAASGAATDLLARPESRIAALFGAGVQARHHARALCAVRSIEEIRVCGRTRSTVEAMVEELRADPEVTARLLPVTTPADALRGAEVVCCTTTALEPVFEDKDLAGGAHVNAVGSFKPEVREVPPETVVRAAVFVDSRAAAWEEAGDLILPLQAGLIRPEHVLGELGELVVAAHPGRQSGDQVTLFKSVGIAVQDAVAAREVLASAGRLGLGTSVEW